MKTSIKTILNHHINKDGRHTVVIQIIRNRRVGTISTPYHLYKHEFNNSKGLAIPSNRSEVTKTIAKEINNFVATQIQKLQYVINDLEIKKNHSSYQI